jgi:hypothetical protein
VSATEGARSKLGRMRGEGESRETGDFSSLRILLDGARTRDPWAAYGQANLVGCHYTNPDLLGGLDFSWQSRLSSQGI